MSGDAQAGDPTRGISADPMAYRGDAARRYVGVGEMIPSPEESSVADADLDGGREWYKRGQFKLYRGRARVPLGLERPRTGPNSAHTGVSSGPEKLGQLLRDMYGISRLGWIGPSAVDAFNSGSVPFASGELFGSNLLRPVPSGGGLYPCELYLLIGEDQHLRAGVYHYDPAHHALDVLRHEDRLASLSDLLGLESEESPGMALLISSFFWKNMFKYREFSYRLQSLDAGVLVGQALVVAGRHSLSTKVHYQFLDRGLDHMLELYQGYESVYAVITLRGTSIGGEDPVAPRPAFPFKTLEGPSDTLDEPWASQKSLASVPLLSQLHASCARRSVWEISAEGSLPPLSCTAPSYHGARSLSGPRVDLIGGLDRRRSSHGYFGDGDLTPDQLAGLLSAATAGYSNDLDGEPGDLRHTLLFCAINRVRGIAPGVYYYHPARHSLREIHRRDVRPELAGVMGREGAYDAAHVSLSVFPTGYYEGGFRVFGDRWYRIQNMEAGVVIQRLYLAAAALGLGCHANTRYDVPAANVLLGLGDGPLRNLAQVMVSPLRGAGYPGVYYEQPI